MLDKKECPICNSTQQESFLTVVDHSVSKETFAIVKCVGCGFHFTNPIPDVENIGKYYKSESYVSHSASNKGIINKIYLLVRKFTLRKKVRLITKESKGKSLLDIGAGTGHFLNVSKKAGFETLGLEPDSGARAFAKSNLEVDLIPSEELHQLPDKSRDVITMWHVLEHVYNLRSDLDKITEVLKDDGVLIVAVPNKNSYDARYYKEFWAAYDVPIHLYHFTPRDINRLFNEYGFVVEKILPMKFDSFYVSMLSEKYRGGNILKAFFIGLKSNFIATPESYSSQIYILRRKTH